MLKKLFIGIGVLAVVAVIGIYMLTSNIDAIVKTAIEEGGSRVTGVSVSLNKSNIDLANARGALFDLRVANPKSFKTKQAIRFGAIGLELGSDSTAQLLVIDKVMIDNPEITYEIGITGSNIDAILDNIDEFTSMTGGSDDNQDAGSDGVGPKLLIKDLYINDGKINVSASLMQGKTLTTVLPNIHLKDIGKKSGGASAGEVADQIIEAISQHAGNAAGSLDLSQLGLGDIGKDMEKNLGSITKGATETLEQAGSGTRDAVESGLKGAGDALKGIFK